MPDHDRAVTEPADLLATRRERFLERLGSGVAVLPAAPELLRSRDTEIRFRQDNDLYYLTGFTEPEAVAVLTPHDPEHRFTLFVRPRDPARERWAGPRFGVQGARERFAADAAYPIEELEERLPDLLAPADRILFALGMDEGMDRIVIEQVARFRTSRPRKGAGPLAVEDPGEILGHMRLVKDRLEIERMRTAARITAAGHRAAMARAAPGIGEWTLEAVLEHAFRETGGRGPAYPPIVASGANATVLHYVTNDRRIEDGDLVLIDAGAEYGMYASDITRTFPVSGRFTEPQREIYDVVLRALEASIAAVRPGAGADAPHRAAARTLCEGLVELGVIEGPVEEAVEEERYKPFYMHRTSHWLGMDVHDVGPYREGGEEVRLEPGMVLTLEPALYFAEEADTTPDRYRGIGVRIEDVALVTEEGCDLLTRDVPVDAARGRGAGGGVGRSESGIRDSG
jgi:Xaa-Pro aminopeptidase